jgi:hypothetical protein
MHHLLTIVIAMLQEQLHWHDRHVAIHSLFAQAEKTKRGWQPEGHGVQTNDTINACKVMWAASESFAETAKCINDASTQ